MDANAIRAWRSARGLSQGDLAGLLGVRLNSVSRWELSMHHPPGRLLDLALDHLAETIPTVVASP